MNEAFVTVALASVSAWSSVWELVTRELCAWKPWLRDINVYVWWTLGASGLGRVYTLSLARFRRLTLLNETTCRPRGWTVCVTSASLQGHILTKIRFNHTVVVLLNQPEGLRRNSEGESISNQLMHYLMHHLSDASFNCNCNALHPQALDVPQPYK
jgi:hypothetical protein